MGFDVKLMVAAAVAIAGAVAYFFVSPQYPDQQVQKKLAEVFVSVSSCRAQVSQIVQATTARQLSPSLFACDGGMSAGVQISPHLKSIAVSAAGAITVTLDFHSLPELTPATNVLTLVPLADASTILRASDVGKPIFAWRCGSPQDGTTLADKYLPADCRG